MGGKGRMKAGNKLIENYFSRMACFSKRRKGLMKKAEEISILTGVNVSVLTISQAGKFYCSDKQVLDSLICPQLVDISSQKEIEMPSETEKGTDVDEMIQELLSSDVPTLNSQLFPEIDISSENVAWESLFPAVEAFDTCREKEENNSWNFDCSQDMAGNKMPFWFNQYDVQSMGCEELERLERAIMEDMQMKLSN
uniref:MADS32 n=1 Tax=Erycina pusilla TaxID=154679 RepID=A0A1L1WP25_9ASPA|nr:MADS32 [Erycina pusilla]